MNNQKGITLVALVITIIVMLIIAETATVAGLDSVKSAQKNRFIMEFDLMQAKVDVIHKKMEQSQSDKEYYSKLGQDVSVISQTKLENILAGTSKEGYRYFSKADLKQLDLDDISQDVIINFETQDIISVYGIEVNGEVYYRKTDIPAYETNKIEYVDKNNKAPTFEVEVNKLSSIWQVSLKNIVYNSNVSGGNVSYKNHNSQNWILVGENTSFEITKLRNI